MKDEGPILCLCLNVSLGDVEQAVRQGARTFQEVQQLTRCGRSCGMCSQAIQQSLDYLLQESDEIVKSPPPRQGQ